MNFGGTNTKLAKRLQRYLENNKVKGAGVSAAFYMDDELIAACTAGSCGKDDTPADITDLYNIGSITKVYTTVAIMKLVEMGKVKLDIPVVKYLPRFKMRDIRYQKITVRMLLNHSSGLPGTNFCDLICDKWTGDSIIDKSYEYFSCSKLKAEPGAFSCYCNDGFELVAAIIKNVSGQSCIDFVRHYITNPIGAYSTGIGNIGVKGRKMMSCKGCNPEWLSVIGAGAIHTEISDCARFGYLFINPSGIIRKELLDEMCKSQGITFLKSDDISMYLGLSWDSIEFKSSKLNLGKHTLTKGGGTLQFTSQLIVSPTYGLSAAISGTNDCNLNISELLCEMIAIVLKDKGYDLGVQYTKVNNNIREVEIAIDKYLSEIRKIYYSHNEVLKIDIKDAKLSLWKYNINGTWTVLDNHNDLQFNNGRFGTDKLSILFEDYKDKKYLIREEDGVKIPFAQRNKNYVPISEGWKKRIGNKYLVCNISAFDLNEDVSIIIDESEETGVLLFKSINDNCVISAISCGNDDTKMFLNIPWEGRDICAPYIFYKDKVEYLRFGGYIYVNLNAIPFLESGKLIKPTIEENTIFKIKAGTHIDFTKPEDVAVFMVDENLSVKYNSHNDLTMPEICDGYIIFANNSTIEFEVSVD